MQTPPRHNTAKKFVIWRDCKTVKTLAEAASFETACTSALIPAKEPLSEGRHFLRRKGQRCLSVAEKNGSKAFGFFFSESKTQKNHENVLTQQLSCVYFCLKWKIKGKRKPVFLCLALFVLKIQSEPLHSHPSSSRLGPRHKPVRPSEFGNGHFILHLQKVFVRISRMYESILLIPDFGIGEKEECSYLVKNILTMFTLEVRKIFRQCSGLKFLGIQVEVLLKVLLLRQLGSPPE